MLFVFSMTTTSQKQSLKAFKEKIGFWSDFIFVSHKGPGVRVYAIHSTAMYYAFNVHVMCQNHMHVQQILLLN